MQGAELRRRLTAILAADAAGYSRLMAADEPGTVAALDAARAVFRARITAHGGRVVDMAGDSVLAVFDTAVGAVNAALEIQAALGAPAPVPPEEQRMRFRIGVHLGDVIEKDDGTVYGDGVNVAARVEGLAEPGGITVSEAVEAALRNRVAVEFEDRGAHAVKYIPHPVRVFTLRTEGSIGVAGAAPAASIATGKPTIAVLAFENMSGDPEQEYFCDGIAEDIITDLSKISGLAVVGRQSSFVYKGRRTDLRQVGRELGVRYVLEGSVRRSGARVRVSTQLIEADAGTYVWANRYDRDAGDAFLMGDEIAEDIVTALDVKLARGEDGAFPDLPFVLGAVVLDFEVVVVLPEDLGEFRGDLEGPVGLVGAAGAAELGGGAGQLLGIAALSDPTGPHGGEAAANVDLHVRVGVGAGAIVDKNRRVLFRSEGSRRIGLGNLPHRHLDVRTRALDIDLARIGQGLNGGFVHRGGGGNKLGVGVHGALQVKRGAAVM